MLVIKESEVIMQFKNIVYLIILCAAFEVLAKDASAIHIGDLISEPVTNTGEVVYITQHLIDGTLFAIDINKKEIIAKVPVGLRPSKPVLDGATIYVITQDKKISIIDTKTFKITAEMRLPHNGDAGATLSKKFHKLYVPHNVHGKISVIDTISQSVVKTIDAKCRVFGQLVLSSDETKLLVMNHDAGTVSVITLS
jgi:DNA-binding beta-propeller fold protein YncE